MLSHPYFIALVLFFAALSLFFLIRKSLNDLLRENSTAAQKQRRTWRNCRTALERGLIVYPEYAPEQLKLSQLSRYAKKQAFKTHKLLKTDEWHFGIDTQMNEEQRLLVFTFWRYDMNKPKYVSMGCTLGIPTMESFKYHCETYHLRFTENGQLVLQYPVKR